MQNILNVLIVENEPLIVDVLKQAFKNLNHIKNRFNIKIVKSCDRALEAIKSSNWRSSIDLALLNTNVPPVQNGQLVFVEDICMKLRMLHPSVKLMLFSSSIDATKINSLLKTLNPESLIVKSDIDYPKLVEAIETVLLEPPFYSKVILKYMRRRICSAVILDNTDKAILYHLSRGIKTKDLPKLVHLSNAGVDKRKRMLRARLGVEQRGDKALLLKAKSHGFV